MFIFCFCFFYIFIVFVLLMINHPCGICGKSVNSNHKAIQCDICNHWIHIKCNGLTSNDYASLQNSSEPWFCTKCIVENLPFGQAVSPLSYNRNISSLEIKEFLSKRNSLELDQAMTGTMSGVNCKYYDANEFFNLDLGSNNFSLFHLNISSLSKHYEELRALLGQLGHGFDIIGITETGFQNNIPITNCVLPGYNYAHTPTKGVKGGALLYISDCLQYTERADLDGITYKDKELESKFIEIIQVNNKNIIVGCIYRHLSMSVNEFNSDYLTLLLDKASLENKLLFLTGDFNVDLLMANSNKDYADYLDILSSYHFLPHIILQQESLIFLTLL